MSRKLTHEEQVAAVAKINPNVEALEEIKGDKVKTLFRCKICGHKWPVAPNSLKKGKGCPECGRLRRLQHLQNRKLTQEEQVKAIYKINPYIEILGRIVNDKTKVAYICKMCGHEWGATPQKLKQGHGCPECAKYGFRNHLEGCLYLLVDDLELPTCIKIGVSNDFNRRLDELTQHTPFPIHVLKVFTFEAGCATSQLERFVHTVFTDRNCHFEGFDGCTEWFWYAHEIVDFLEENC